MNLHDLFLYSIFSIFIDRKGLSKAPEGGYLGYRPIVDGVVGDYEWIT